MLQVTYSRHKQKQQTELKQTKLTLQETDLGQAGLYIPSLFYEAQIIGVEVFVECWYAFTLYSLITLY